MILTSRPAMLTLIFVHAIFCPSSRAVCLCVSIAKDLFRFIFLSQSNDRCIYGTSVQFIVYRYVINCLDSDILCWMWHITYIYKVVLLIHSWILHSRWLNCIGAPNEYMCSSFESLPFAFGSNRRCGEEGLHQSWLARTKQFTLFRSISLSVCLVHASNSEI